MGSQNNRWNAALEGGFWMLFFEIVFTGTGYICLSLCMAEMSSALPFSGGIFGFVRASTGPFYGYIVACTELLFNTLYVVLMVDPIADLPVTTGLVSESAVPAVFFGIYAFLLCICVLGGKPFWSFNMLFGICSLLLILIYVLGTLCRTGSPSEVNFSRFAQSSIPFTFINALKYRQSGAHQFLGVHYLPLASANLKDPKTQLPRMMVTTVLILFVSAICIVLAAASQAPGIHALSKRDFPLDYGFASIFGVSLQFGQWLHFPGMVAAAFGFTYCFGRQLYSISKSGLLPSVFTRVTPVVETPYLALICGCILCFGLNLWHFFVPRALEDFKNIATLALLTVVLNAYIAFIIFRVKFSNITRSFVNPLGIYSAVYGLINSGVGIIGTVFFRGKDYTPITTLLVFLTVGTLFYVFYMSKRQTFSEEEKKHLFKAYLINGKEFRIFGNFLLLIILLSFFFFSKSPKQKENV
jgi:ethanolamine permease